ncbi:MAG: hypothetical protein E6J91_40860 [Deltaproteobacteria bacterium]|nr:MAG: hypothetical protein E6J91_40860 [Deltaproteobacteria bacterium]
MTHLDLLNAVLALRFRQPGWPPILAEAGYLVHNVGVTFKLPDGAKVAPDVIATSQARNVALLIEVKGGGGFDHDQAGRMERVTAEDLRHSAYLPIDPSACRIGIVYVCSREHHAAFEQATAARAGTVISFDGTSFQLGGNALPDEMLAAAWAAATVTPGAPPLAIIPFDQESDAATIARTVIPELVAILLRGAGVVFVDEILQRTHHLVHSVMQPTGSKAEWQGLKKRVTEFLNEVARGELNPWLERIPQQPMWRFKSAVPADQTTRTRELKNLQRSTQVLIERLGGGAGIQLELFDRLE